MANETIEVLRIPGTLFPRGPYDETATYKFLNFVESGGSGYVCLQPCTGIPVTNTAYWFKFVFKGETGAPFTYADLTAEQKAELVRDATAAAQAAASSAQSAAVDAAATLQKFNTIKAAIDAIDPTSTEGSIQTLAAKQGLLEAELDALVPEVSGIRKRFNTSVARLLATVLRKIAYIDTSVQDSANELIAILDAQASVLSISATYIGGQKYTGDTISVSDFAAVATYDDGTTGSVTASSVSPARLTSTSTQVTVTYNGKTTVVTVPATFNAVVDISDISTTQTNAAEGQSVDLSAITYTLHYANGNSVEMNDPNIITATPSVLSAGTNNITIALADDPTIDGILTINAGGAVTSAYVEKTFTNAANTSSGLLTFPSPMTVTPVSIVITNPTTAGSAAARLRGATLTYNSQTDTWGGTAYMGNYPASNVRTLTNVTVALSGDEGSWTGATISNIQCTISGSTYTAQFRGDYTFTFTSETSAS